MTRDNTIALLLICEASRMEARRKALDEGKSEEVADDLARDAARKRWNEWAEDLLAQQKAAEADGVWEQYGKDWSARADVDFSSCLFPSKDTVHEGKGATVEAARAAQAGGSIKSFCVPTVETRFDGFLFPGAASFDSAVFLGSALFDKATFEGNASFNGAVFNDRASFFEAVFRRSASFDNVAFERGAQLARAAFNGQTTFHSANFMDYARFYDAKFKEDTKFDSVVFRGDTVFDGAAFRTDTSFDSAGFHGAASFETTIFKGRALFDSVTFKGNVRFDGASFGGATHFGAIRSERAFVLAAAVLDAVPDFIQAHFEEAPRLDNLQIYGRQPYAPQSEIEEQKKAGRGARLHYGLKGRSRTYRRVAAADRDIPARWRALKRLAIQGHDTDRELEFHACELRSQRFAGHWPLPAKTWSRSAWGGFFGFWFGLLYGLTSDFGRSLARPFLFWFVAVVLGAVFYLSQSPEIVAARHKQESKGASVISAAASRAWHAWQLKPVRCYEGEKSPMESEEEFKKRSSIPNSSPYSPPPYIGALSPSLQSGTDLANEAWHLAFRNAFIVLDGSSEATHRTFGCLYGVEMYGGSNPLAVIPSAVSTVSAAQKLFSGLMIFLFGLALRNMLKVK